MPPKNAAIDNDVRHPDQVMTGLEREVQRPVVQGNQDFGWDAEEIERVGVGHVLSSDRRSPLGWVHALDRAC